MNSRNSNNTMGKQISIKLLLVLVVAALGFLGGCDAFGSINIFKHRYPFYGGAGYGGYPFWGGYGAGYGGITLGGYGRR